jgi:Cu(I)/Ag(I) efflux system membrane fusion protein
MIARIARIALLIAALAAAWYFTRSAPASAPVAAGHQHGGSASSATAQPVRLDARDQRRIGVTFATVTRGVLQRNVRIVAQVGFDETRVVTVAARVEGYAEQLYVNFAGQRVRAGEPLLRLASPMIATTAGDLLLALRLERELEDGGPDARRNATQLVSSARQRLIHWQVSETEIRGIEESGTVPHTITLRAPAGGVVLEKGIVQGQRIMEGDPLYRIADLGVVWVEGEVFEQDLALARVGQPVTAEFQALPGTTRTGRISYVYPTLSPDTRTGRVRVTLANPGMALKPGMFATIHLSTPITTAVLSVPRAAVLSTGERNLVFLKRPDGRFTPTDVVLGAQTEDRLEILQGLAEGDVVVASATFLVDAESNLGTLLGGMGNMPGMDMTAPGAVGDSAADAPPAMPDMQDMPGMQMPGLDSGAPQVHTGPGG